MRMLWCVADIVSMSVQKSSETGGGDPAPPSSVAARQLAGAERPTQTHMSDTSGHRNGAMLTFRST